MVSVTGSTGDGKVKMKDDMGRWVWAGTKKGNREPDICKHGKHATSLKNLELQFMGVVAVSPCPVCLAELKKDNKNDS